MPNKSFTGLGKIMDKIALSPRFPVNVICVLLLCAMAILALPIAMSQTSGRFPENDKNGKPLIPRPNPFLWYSPADLAHNAITLPASAATSPTNIVPVSGATALTLYVNCTQTSKVTINVYTADDLPNSTTPFVSYTLYGSYDLVTSNTLAAGAQQIYIGTELAPTTTSGTLSISVRLPQIAVSFTETNGTATPGTCTDRLAVKYN